MAENQPTNTYSDVHTNGVTNKDVPTTKGVPPTEVTPRAKRRTFSAQYKLRILEEADRCTQHGEIGALLRREGLYSSNLTTWRGQRKQRQFQGLKPKQRGRKKSEDAALREELDQLHRENGRLARRLEKAETIIEVQKKLYTLLGLPEEQTVNTDKI